MEQLLSFLSDLILFTAGLVVAGIWIVAIILASVEIYDRVIGEKDQEDEDV